MNDVAASSLDITTLLGQWSRGDRGALDRVVPLVYAELRRIAARQLRRESPGQPIQPTDLVHALFLELVDQRYATWESRAEFYAVVALMMRRILVDHARARRAAKRGGLSLNVSLDEARDGAVSTDSRVAEVLEIDQLLGRLEEFDPDQARIVELRFFAGLSVEETARALDRSPRTIKREWRMARAWLFRELKRSTHSTTP
jgi:RNA polymerase sigma factor (TIGR02999 family)